MRVVIEREKYIDRPRAHRQRRHQARKQRAGPFGRYRRHQHESGGDGHFDDEREREIKVGRHYAGVSTTRPVTLPARSSSCTALTSFSGRVETGTSGRPLRRTRSISSVISGTLPTYEP